MTNSQSGPNRPILGLALLFGAMIALIAAQKAMGMYFIQPVRLGVLAVFAGGAFWLVYRYWRSIDEAAQDAQKTAWFWGGSLAAIPALVLASVLGDPRNGLSDHLLILAPHGNIVVAGALLLGLAQLVGFTVAWAIWWAAKR